MRGPAHKAVAGLDGPQSTHLELGPTQSEGFLRDNAYFLFLALSTQGALMMKIQNYHSKDNCRSSCDRSSGEPIWQSEALQTGRTLEHSYLAATGDKLSRTAYIS